MIMPKTGIYAITQTKNKQPEEVINEVTEALKAGISLLQYRDKKPIDALYLAHELKKICHHYHVPLIINDNPALAQQVAADGVHLGKGDGQIKYARHLLGDKAIIGVSCYNNLEYAQQMVTQSANYVAFGRFFPSQSKPEAAQADVETLIRAKTILKVPIVAIGGITINNGASLLNSGADLLAVIDGIFNTAPYYAVQQYQSLFTNSHEETCAQ